MTFQDIIHEAVQSKWQPTFGWTNPIDIAADCINLPHEDYPLGVGSTTAAIREMSESIRVTWADACNIQKYVFQHKMQAIDILLSEDHSQLETPDLRPWAESLPGRYINLGLRRIEVQVGHWKPPHPMFLQDLIEKVFPVTLSSTIGIPQVSCPGIACTLQFWYQLFQTIHPFEDLNGRVGGIIVAALSHQQGGQYLAPKRFEK
jgi:hypothetical protein